MAGLDSKLTQGLDFDGGGRNVSAEVKGESLTLKLDDAEHGDSLSGEDDQRKSDKVKKKLFPSDSGCEGDEEVSVDHLNDRLERVVSVEDSRRIEDGTGSQSSHVEESEVGGISNVVINDGDISSSHRQKPGVILLGRGNSFSLGRSEVIVIHRRHKRSNDLRTNASRNVFNSNKEKLVLDLHSNNNHNDINNPSNNNHFSKSYPLSRIQEKQDSDNNDLVEFGESFKDVVVSNIPSIPSPSPPPISNGLSLVETSGHGDNDDLKDLWQKAEAVMALRNDKVRNILEEFGIGEPGGGGGEEENYWEDEEVIERKKEEEDVWRIIQENFQV